MAEVLKINLEQRPFAIDTITKMMLPDGIFIKSHNGGNALMRAKLLNPVYNQRSQLPRLYFLQNVESSEIIIQNGEQLSWKGVFSNQEYFYWDFLVNLSSASIGKHKITINIKLAHSRDPFFGGRSPIEFIGEIYVADAHFDASKLDGAAYFPEGKLNFKIIGSHIFRDKKFRNEKLPTSIILPKEISSEIKFAQPFDGLYGPIPFNDPWWKVAGWIVAGIAGAVAGIWVVGGELGWWDSPIYHKEEGTYNPETGERCPDCGPGPRDQYTYIQGDPLWGVFVAACALGVAVGLADLIDPYRRGESKSVPKDGDKTVSERLDFTIDYMQFPLAGTSYKIGVDWKFQRHGTIVNRYDAVNENDEQQNIHYLSEYNVYTSDGQLEYPINTTHQIDIIVDFRKSEEFIRFKKEVTEGLRKKIPEFYVLGYLRNRHTGVLKSAIFTRNNNIYVGSFILFDHDPLGEWDVMVVVQNVNNADSEYTAEEKAEIIGGFIYSKNFIFIQHRDDNKCMITPNWDITIKLI